MSRTPKKQLVHFLSDMYSVEQQALAQMVSAPKLAGDSRIAADFSKHYAETETQANLVEDRLKALGGSPSAIKDTIMRLGGKGFLLFAQVMPETPGRLVNHAYSYEAMEWAGYEMLRGFAERVDDRKTADVATQIGAQEREMMGRLERDFDLAEAMSHASLAKDKLQEHLIKHLTEVHAFESQNMQLLAKSEEIAGSEALAGIYNHQHAQIHEHARQVELRLEAMGESTSKARDGALSLGGMNWGLFFQAQSDTPAKLAAFVYAVLYLEIGGYELLKRTSQRAGDAETKQLCEAAVTDKVAMAERLAEAFDEAVDSTLGALKTGSA